MLWAVFQFVAGCLFGLAASIDPIEVVGNKFFRKDGSQYFMKGKRSSQILNEDCGRKSSWYAY
jgi:hypothetical protein